MVTDTSTRRLQISAQKVIVLETGKYTVKTYKVVWHINQWYSAIY
jgi:hypothetical protein